MDTACIERAHADHKGKSWCGRSINGIWSFVCIDHAAEHGLAEGRILACLNCVREIAASLGKSSG